LRAGRLLPAGDLVQQACVTLGEDLAFILRDLVEIGLE
jgi:hypothetical protein